MKVQIEVTAEEASAVQRFLTNLSIIQSYEASFKELMYKSNSEGRHYLEDKFLVTGADTLSPTPLIPQRSREEAEDRANELIHDIRTFKQKSVIVWAPIAVVEEDGNVRELK